MSPDELTDAVATKISQIFAPNIFAPHSQVADGLRSEFSRHTDTATLGARLRHSPSMYALSHETQSNHENAARARAKKTLCVA